MPKELTKKGWPRRCRHRGCRKTVQKSEQSALCGKHRSAQFKKKFPLKYHFNLLKCNATRRHKIVQMCFEEYERLARESGYDEKRGKEANSLTLDRIDNDGPYSIDNLRVTTHAENVSKGARKMFVPYFQSLSESDKAPPKTEPPGDAPWTQLNIDDNEPF